MGWLGSEDGQGLTKTHKTRMMGHENNQRA